MHKDTDKPMEDSKTTTVVTTTTTTNTEPGADGPAKSKMLPLIQVSSSDVATFKSIHGMREFILEAIITRRTEIERLQFMLHELA